MFSRRRAKALKTGIGRACQKIRTSPAETERMKGVCRRMEVSDSPGQIIRGLLGNGNEVAVRGHLLARGVM